MFVLATGSRALQTRTSPAFHFTLQLCRPEGEGFRLHCLARQGLLVRLLLAASTAIHLQSHYPTLRCHLTPFREVCCGVPLLQIYKKTIQSGRTARKTVWLSRVSLGFQSGWDSKLEWIETRKWATPLPPQIRLQFSITGNSLWTLGSSWRLKPPNTKNKSLYEHKKSGLWIWCWWALPFGKVLASSAELSFSWEKGLPIWVCGFLDVLSGQLYTAASPAVRMPQDLSCWAPELVE